MEALQQLRESIVAGHDIHEDGNDLVLQGNKYPKKQRTPFKSGGSTTSGQYYTLGALWLQHEMRSSNFLRYRNAAKEKDVGGFVLVTDKKAVVDYLSGKDTGERYIDNNFVLADATEAAGLSTAAGDDQTTHSTSAQLDNQVDTTHKESKEDNTTNIAAASMLADWHARDIRDVLDNEINFRTRESILEAVNGQDLSSMVFDKFQRGNIAAKRGVAGAEAIARAKRQAIIGTGGTPIIVVPNSQTSLLNLYNARYLLEQSKFVEPSVARAEAGSAAKPPRITIRRNDARGVPMQYYVTDSVQRLAKHDWKKIVAVFAHGPEWQYKGWKWGGDPNKPDTPPVDIFDKCLGFHIAFDGDDLNPNIAKWNITTLLISKSRRHLDPVVASKFWEMVDQFIMTRKPYLMKPAPKQKQ